MRGFSHSEAIECETAVGTVCKCRCQGAYHGARRELSALPETDSHFVPSEETRKETYRFNALVTREHRLHGLYTLRDRQHFAAGIPETLRDWHKPMAQWPACPKCIERIAKAAVSA